jgi:hypothetical protein
MVSAGVAGAGLSSTYLKGSQTMAQAPLTLTHSIIRRLNNFPLAPSPDNSLIGVYEAISNSLHAADDADEPSKVTIYVEVVRDRESNINGFRIIDNGVGLNQVNFNSFLKVDSDLKLRRGGKGVGRLTWLKTFDRIHIQSRFLECGKWFVREFDFIADDESPLPNYSLMPTTNATSRTVVELFDMKREYFAVTPKRAKTILKSITRHFVRDLISSSTPRIIVEDGGSTELNKFFMDNVVRTGEDEIDFELGGKEFRLGVRHILVSSHLQDRETNENTLYLLAHGRVVDRRAIGGLLGLKRFGSHTYLGLVESELFDMGVSQERTMLTLNVDLVDRVT